MSELHTVTLHEIMAEMDKLIDILPHATITRIISEMATAQYTKETKSLAAVTGINHVITELANSDVSDAELDDECGKCNQAGASENPSNQSMIDKIHVKYIIIYMAQACRQG